MLTKHEIEVLQTLMDSLERKIEDDERVVSLVQRDTQERVRSVQVIRGLLEKER